MKNQSKTMESQQSLKKRSFAKEINLNWNFEIEIEKREIKNTPFTLIRREKTFFIVVGSYKISEERDEWESLFKEYSKPTFDNIMRLVGVMIEENEKWNHNFKDFKDEENK